MGQIARMDGLSVEIFMPEIIVHLWLLLWHLQMFVLKKKFILSVIVTLFSRKGGRGAILPHHLPISKQVF